MNAERNALVAKVEELALGIRHTAERYYATQRAVATPELSLRAVAAEMARVLVDMAKSIGVDESEAARALALAMATAMRGQDRQTMVVWLRLTADWIEGQPSSEKAPASGARKVA